MSIDAIRPDSIPRDTVPQTTPGEPMDAVELMAPPELTRQTVKPFRRALLTAAQLVGPEGVTADLKATVLLDGAGVGALIAAAKALRGAGSRLSVRLTPGTQPQRVFQRMGLARVIVQIASAPDAASVTAVD